MIKLQKNTKINDELFRKFCETEKLSPLQETQFYNYASLLLESNENINLTAITQSADLISYHFQDSIKIREYVDFTSLRCIADVGTGGGFPGIPLKILFPHLQVILIEVTHKKIEFLKMVIDQLGLQNIEIAALDWRTFLRKTSYNIDCFVARASLSVPELLRIFRASCSYNTAFLIYWASRQWQIVDSEKEYFLKEVHYGVGVKKRRFIFFGKNTVIMREAL